MRASAFLSSVIRLLPIFLMRTVEKRWMSNSWRSLCIAHTLSAAIFSCIQIKIWAFSFIFLCSHSWLHGVGVCMYYDLEVWGLRWAIPYKRRKKHYDESLCIIKELSEGTICFFVLYRLHFTDDSVPQVTGVVLLVKLRFHIS